MGGVGNGTQLGAQTPQRFGGNESREIGRQSPAGGGLDRGKDVGGTAAVKPVHRARGGGRHADAAERLGKDRSRDWFAVDNHALTIEDDQGSLRLFGHSRWPRIRLFEEVQGR